MGNARACRYTGNCYVATALPREVSQLRALTRLELEAVVEPLRYFHLQHLQARPVFLLQG